MNDDTLCDALTLTVERAVYPLQAVLRTIYWLAPDADIAVGRDGDNWALTITPKGANDPVAVCERLKTGLVDFAIRVDVEEKTAGLREAIWRTAFAEAVPE